MPGGPGGMQMPDLNSPEMKQQFDQMGMSPQDVRLRPGRSPRADVSPPLPGMHCATCRLTSSRVPAVQIVQKIMSDPELASAFQNPKIQQAVMELSSNPMAMPKYQNDPEVMKVLNKMMEVFPQAGAGMGMPGQPGMPNQ